MCFYNSVSGGVSVLKWMDKKPVHVLTTKMDPTEKIVVTTRTGVKEKPKAVQDYIINMAGVDKSDQLMAYMPLNRKTLKWWKKLFFHLFTLSLIQASILHELYQKTQRNPKISLKKFIVLTGNAFSVRYHAAATAARLPAAAPAAQPLPAPPPQSPPADAPGTSSSALAMHTPQTRLSGGHYSTVLPVLSSGVKTYRNCHVCIARSRRMSGVKHRQSANWCAKCGITLCEKLCQGKDVTCFQVYHTIHNYADY